MALKAIKKTRLYDFHPGASAKSSEVDNELNQFIASLADIVDDLLSIDTGVAAHKDSDGYKHSTDRIANLSSVTGESATSALETLLSTINLHLNGTAGYLHNTNKIENASYIFGNNLTEVLEEIFRNYISHRSETNAHGTDDITNDSAKYFGEENTSLTAILDTLNEYYLTHISSLTAHNASKLVNDSGVDGTSISDALNYLKADDVHHEETLMAHNASVIVNDSIVVGEKVKDALNTLGAAIVSLETREPSQIITGMQADIIALAYPVTTTLTVTPSIVEVGSTVPNLTFNFTINNISSAKSAAIVDITEAIPVDVVGLDTSNIINSSSSYTEVFDYQYNVIASKIYKVNIIDACDRAVSSPTKSVSWCWAVYSGSSASTGLDEAGIEELTKTIKAGFAGDYVYTAASGYKYVVYASELGTATVFKDKATGFAVDMQPLKTYMVRNVNMCNTIYNIHRTTNILNSAITIAVS